MEFLSRIAEVVLVEIVRKCLSEETSSFVTESTLSR